MAIYTCRRCDHEQPEPWSAQCPSCRGFYRPKKVGADSAEQGGFRTLGGGKIKSQHTYLSTGQPGFDHVLGGGLVAGRVVLFGGFAGTGKTRLMLMVCDYIAKTQGIAIYASGEESTDDLDGIAGSLGIVNDRVIIMGSQMMVEKVIEVAKKTKAFLVIYDSGQKFSSAESAGSPGSGAQCRAIGEAIKSYCGSTKTCAIIINQMSGQGDLKGGTELEHHCDTIMVLAYPKDDDEDVPDEKDVRVLAGSKNRVGAENQKSYWKMHGKDDERPGFLENIPAKSKLIEVSRGKYGKS